MENALCTTSPLPASEWDCGIPNAGMWLFGVVAKPGGGKRVLLGTEFATGIPLFNPKPPKSLSHPLVFGGGTLK